MPYKDSVKQKESHHRWHLKNRVRILEKQKEYQLKIKLIVFNHYGRKGIQCACCGEEHIKFLSIDHIEGGGTAHRKKIGSHYIYFWLIKNGFPDGFRILCHNCNQAIGAYGVCPHKEVTREIS